MTLNFRSSLLRNLACVLLAFLTVFVHQPHAHARQDDAISPESIVAQVDSITVVFREVQNQLQLSIGNKSNNLSPQQLTKLQAAALKQLVEQQIVVSYLKSQGKAASKARIKLDIDRLTRRAESIGKTFEGFLKENNVDQKLLEKKIAWQNSWRDFLKSQISEERLQKVFEADRRFYDGTKVRVAHLLIKPENSGDANSWAAAKLSAEKLLAQYKSGEVSWKDAVEQFSQAATTTNSGEIGWIKNDGTMNQAFTKSAFSLAQGDVSQPVRTPFGFHLIRLLELEAGDKTWKDCAEQLEAEAAKILFEWVVKRHRPKVSVEYYGNSPYTDPKTGELIMPGQKPD